MNIYTLVEKNNRDNYAKTALTIAQDNGEMRSYTFGQLFQKVEKFAEKLLSSKILKGDRVALVAENSPEWNIAYLAVLKINCTAVLIDASLSAEEIVQLITTSDVRGIYTSPTIMQELANKLNKQLPVFNLLKESQVFSGYPLCVSESIEPTIDGDSDISTIIFSSGTTRSAEGIMHGHQALVDSTMMCATSNNLDQDGRYLSVIPNSHIYGLICLVLAPMLLGANIRYIESMNGEAIKKAFDDYQPTIFPCVPKVFDLFKEQAVMTINSRQETRLLFKLFFPVTLFLRKKFNINLGKILFKSIHQAFGGSIDILCSAGAPMDKQTANFYLGTGFNLLLTYGATETNIPTIGNRGNNLTADTCGKPYDGVAVKLSQTGEIMIKSPYMMKGYFRNPEATAAVFEEGWLKTGDLGSLNSQGNYQIIGRSKENIVLASGKKLIPDEVEAQYGDISGVSELIVSGVPVSAGSYDEVHAFIVKTKVDVETAGILQEIQNRSLELASHMKFSKIHFVDEIPKTSLQKPKRFLLQKQALAEVELKTETKIITDFESKETIELTLIRLVAKAGELDPILVTPNSKPFSELGIDSLSAMALAFQIEEHYKIKVDEYFTQEITIKELATYIENPSHSEGKQPSANNYPKGKKHIDYILFKCACGLARMLYKVTVKNQKEIPENSGYIICANHVSNLDYLWLTVNFKKAQFHNFCCMAKEELVNKAAISKLLARVCGMIPVNRANAGLDAIAYCKDKLSEKAGLLIHPEGTRSTNGQLGILKHGAAVLAIESKVPIVPAYIKGAYEIYPRSQKLPRLFNFTKMRKYPVEVIYGNPIHPQNLSAEELIKKVEASILSLSLQTS